MNASDRLVLHDAEVDGTLVDLILADGVVADIVPAGARGSASRAGADVFDVHGGAVIPGLHDHHIHLLALAAARRSITFSAAILDDLRIADRTRPPGEWLRVTGYHESIAGEIDRAWLDSHLPDRPVRVQHRTGAMWVLNSAALAATGLDSPDGRLLGADESIRERAPHAPIDLAAVGRELASYGVTAVTDMTPTEDAEEVRFLAGAVLRKGFPLSVMVTGGAGLGADVAPALERGPVKIVVGDHDLPTIEDLVTTFGAARRQRRNVAVHCVTRIGLLLALAAWGEVGSVPGDRIEHGAVIPLDQIGAITDLGLTVVTQPSFVRERGDQYLADVDADDVAGLWRCGSLLDAGVPVGGSTDAPFGDADPWRAIVAATERRTASGSAIGLDECIDTRRALELFLTSPRDPGSRPRRIVAGEPADLCVLRAPLADVLRTPSSALVAATFTGGRLHVS